MLRATRRKVLPKRSLILSRGGIRRKGGLFVCLFNSYTEGLGPLQPFGYIRLSTVLKITLSRYYFAYLLYLIFLASLYLYRIFILAYFILYKDFVFYKDFLTNILIKILLSFIVIFIIILVLLI